MMLPYSVQQKLRKLGSHHIVHLQIFHVVKVFSGMLKYQLTGIDADATTTY